MVESGFAAVEGSRAAVEKFKAHKVTVSSLVRAKLSSSCASQGAKARFLVSGVQGIRFNQLRVIQGVTRIRVERLKFRTLIDTLNP